MVYDETLAQKLRFVLKGKKGITEKKMFGGVAFLLHGNMAVGVNRDDLIVRVDPANHAQLLKLPHARTFDFTGKPMQGWLLVNVDGLRKEADLKKWIELGVAYAKSLPKK